MEERKGNERNEAGQGNENKTDKSLLQEVLFYQYMVLALFSGTKLNYANKNRHVLV